MLISVWLVAGIFAVVYGLHIWRIQEPPEDLSAAMAAATGVIGTLVGTFFGHQLGAAGKERVERRAEEARSEPEGARREAERERVRRAVDANLTSAQAEKLLKHLEQTWSEPPR